MAGEGDDEEIVPGTEGQDTPGSDPGAGDDEGEVSAEHTDEEADDGEQEVDPAPPQRGGRAESRIQRLANEAKAAREEAAAARREAEEARRAAAQRQERESQEVYQARRALMTPEERTADDMAQLRREFAQQRQQDQMTTAALMDKTAYDAKATINPVYAKFKDEVEDRFQDLARRGQPVEREILLKVLLGERALEGAGKSGPARRQASRRVESQRVAPGSGRGDAPSNRGRAGDTAESRLKGVII